MNDDQRELRTLLGLTPEDCLDVLIDVPVAGAKADLGFATEGLASQLAAAPNGDLLELGLDLKLRVWERQAGVFGLELAAADELLYFSGVKTILDDGSCWVDARVTPARAHVELASGYEAVVSLGADRVRAARVMRQLPTFDLAGMPEASLVQPWLNSLCAELGHSPLRLDRLSAVGYSVRHARLTEVGACVERMLKVRQERRAYAKTWWDALRKSQKVQLMTEARDLAERLSDTLLGLGESVALDSGSSNGAAQRALLIEQLCIERERLQAAKTVFSLGADTSPLAGALTQLERLLTQLDEDAVGLLATVAEVELTHPLLIAVAELEPDAWWGTHWDDDAELY